MIKVGGSGNSSAKLVVVGDFINSHEEKDRRQFTGPTGRMFDQILTDCNIQRTQLYITTVIKYNLPNAKALETEGYSYEDAIQELRGEIRTIRPNAILALGQLAFTALTGNKGKIGNWRGSILKTNFQVDGEFTKVVGTNHPRAFFYNTDNKYEKLTWKDLSYIRLDYKRAWEESKSRIYDIPQRNLQIIKDPYIFQQFIDRYKDYDICAADIEVIKCIPVCISFAFTRQHAVSIPLLNIKDTQIPDLIMIELWKQVDYLLRNKKIVGQNWKFDEKKLIRPCGLRPNFYADTGFLAHVLHSELPKKLAFITSVYTKQPYYKDDGKEFNLAKQPMVDLYTYNAMDSAVQIEVYEEMLKYLKTRGHEKFYWDFVTKLHRFYSDIEDIGFAVDRDIKEYLSFKYDQWLKRLEFELIAAIGIEAYNEFKPKPDKNKIRKLWNSPILVKRLLYEHLQIPERKDTSEETLCALLANTVKDDVQRNAIEAIYQLRRVEKAKKLMNTRPDYDGRLRTSVNISGTETGRTSNNIYKPPTRPDKLGIVFQTITKHGEFGPEAGEFIVSDEGYLLAEADLSQAEARIVALLAEDYTLLKQFDTIDIHSLTASWIFNKPMYQIDRKTERFIGKTARHAGNYDMGKRRFMLDTQGKARRFNIPINISEAEANRVLTVFHKYTPNIRGVFHKRVKKALVDHKMELINPFGRPRLFLGKLDDEVYREAYAQIPQSTVGDKIKKAGMDLLIRKPSIKIVGESHDALKFLLKEDSYIEDCKMIKEEFEKEIDFSKCTLQAGKLIIPCEIKVGKNLRQMEEVRLG